MTPDAPGDLDAVAASTAPKAFLRTVAARPAAVALRARDAGGALRTWSWADVAIEVARRAAGLAAHGVGPGDRVLLLMRNRPEFHWFDLAAQFLRAVPVSIYTTSSTEEIRYLAGHAGARIAVVEDQAFAERVTAARSDLPDLAGLFVLDGIDERRGDTEPAGALVAVEPADLDGLAAATRPDDLATLVYTSGTTGPPKGVMLDQANIVVTAEQLRRCLDVEDLAGWRVVSYLPMAHIAERMVSHYLWMIQGAEVTCCAELDRLGDELRATRPELVFGVPRVWEKLHAAVLAALAVDAERLARFTEGVALALEVQAAVRAGTATAEQRATWNFLDAVAFGPLRTLAGLDAVRVAVSGAAPLPRALHEWFLAVGVPMSEIYGLSESSGPITWEPNAVRPGTVGRAIPGCQVRLADDGEILCRGGNVFRGYWRDPERTAEALADGWLHTGDIGRFDADGYLRVVDRKKELLITSGGKNVSPANLEAALRSLPLIGQVCAVGDDRPYIAALVTLDPDYAPVWAATHGLDGLDPTELATHPALLAELERGIADVNEQFAPVEQVKRFVVLADVWQPGSDVLTPTAKLKRRRIAARYADAIEGLYRS